MNWNILEKSLLDYFNAGINDKNRTIENTCRKIDELYINEMKNSGREQYGNPVVNIIPGPLETSLKIAMTSTMSIKSGPPEILNNSGLLGITQTWIGGIMGQIFPPPSAASVVTNVVLIPGIMFTMNIPEQKFNSLENIFIKELIIALKKHAATVSGICTALVDGVPIPFPWIGIL